MNGSETNVLLFEYIVEVGDNSPMLDYWSDVRDSRRYVVIFK